MVVKIQIKKSVEEFDIAGKVYQMDMSDNAIDRYRSEWESFEKEIDALDKKYVTNSKESEEAYKDLFVRFYGLILGKGSFDQIYEATGKSSLVMADIIKQVMDVVEVKHQANATKNKQKYTGNKRRRR